MVRIFKSAVTVLVLFALVGFVNVTLCSSATKAENINKCTVDMEDGSVMWITPPDADPDLCYLN